MLIPRRLSPMDWILMDSETDGRCCTTCAVEVAKPDQMRAPAADQESSLSGTTAGAPDDDEMPELEDRLTLPLGPLWVFPMRMSYIGRLPPRLRLEDCE